MYVTNHHHIFPSLLSNLPLSWVSSSSDLILQGTYMLWGYLNHLTPSRNTMEGIIKSWSFNLSILQINWGPNMDLCISQPITTQPIEKFVQRNKSFIFCTLANRLGNWSTHIQISCQSSHTSLLDLHDRSSMAPLTSPWTRRQYTRMALADEQDDLLDLAFLIRSLSLYWQGKKTSLREFVKIFT